MTVWVEELVRSMGYIGLTVLTFLENIFPPIPSELILPLGGFLVAQERLTMAGVILAGTVGSLAGAIVLYYVGMIFNGERLKNWVEAYGGWLLLNPRDVDSAFHWFEKYGGAAVFVCRLIPGIRSLISLPAGAFGMPMPKFLLYSTAGTALWSALLAFAGQFLGHQYDDLGLFLKWISYAAIGMVSFSIVVWYIQKRRDQKSRRNEPQRREQQAN